MLLAPLSTCTADVDAGLRTIGLAAPSFVFPLAEALQ